MIYLHIFDINASSESDAVNALEIDPDEFDIDDLYSISKS